MSGPEQRGHVVVEVDRDSGLVISTDITLLDAVPIQIVHLENASDR